MGEQFNFRLDPELKKAFGEEEGESEVYEEDATYHLRIWEDDVELEAVD